MTSIHNGDSPHAGEDQYADGNAAEVWAYYIGPNEDRTSQYKSWLKDIMTEFNCNRVIDVACGTGIDSILLLEDGYDVTSTDGSYQMLKFALKRRWNRRKEEAFDGWEIEEANWLSIPRDLARHGLNHSNYDAVICLGNSFAHLMDTKGDKSDMMTALKNFKQLLKPGGVLVIDHRNYDALLDTGNVPIKNVYYNSSFLVDIDTVTVHKNGQPSMVTLHYTMDVPSNHAYTLDAKQNGKNDGRQLARCNSVTRFFTLSYYPHRLQDFSELLTQAFGKEARHAVYGDFKLYTKRSSQDEPAFFIHVIQNPE